MLPWLIGGAIVGIGAMLLDDSQSSGRKRAKKRYKETKRDSIAQIDNRYKKAQRKDTLDKLFKVKRAKVKIADDIYTQLKSSRDRYQSINMELVNSKKELDNLFLSKKSLSTKREKQEVQNQINMIIQMRKNIFQTKDILKFQINEIDKRLKVANKDTKEIQNSINIVVKERV